MFTQNQRFFSRFSGFCDGNELEQRCLRYHYERQLEFISDCIIRSFLCLKSSFIKTMDWGFTFSVRSFSHLWSYSFRAESIQTDSGFKGSPGDSNTLKSFLLRSPHDIVHSGQDRRRNETKLTVKVANWCRLIVKGVNYNLRHLKSYKVSTQQRNVWQKNAPWSTVWYGLPGHKLDFPHNAEGPLFCAMGPSHQNILNTAATQALLCTVGKLQASVA